MLNILLAIVFTVAGFAGAKLFFIWVGGWCAALAFAEFINRVVWKHK